MAISNFEELGKAMKGKNTNYIDYQVGLEKSDLTIMSEILEKDINLQITDSRVNLFEFIGGYNGQKIS